ncbi:glycerate kinase [Actinomyces naeslundii]|uniref:glycerate kinase n=1 Tax=Actinomyces naeslundii TaxID=1655 RepID=UPI003B987AAC
MRIVVAPDSFKESMTAVQAARAMAVGVRDALPTCLIDQVPVSDGGEGFAEAVTAAWDASWQEVTTVDALGRPRTAGFGRDSDRAVIDLASSVGLEHILPGERDVMRSSTIGLGHVIASAVDAGARSLLIGLGGSASNDMGLGMLVALGARCLDERGGEVEPVPTEFSRIRRIEVEPARRRLEGVSITVAGDVTNPLTGSHGAAAVFGPQKGLTGSAITWIDGEMMRLAAVLGLSHWACRPGTGAAGGTAFALAAVLGAELAIGIDHLARVVGLRERLEEADLLLTGRGPSMGSPWTARRSAECSAWPASAGCPPSSSPDGSGSMSRLSSVCVIWGPRTSSRSPILQRHWRPLSDRARVICAGRLRTPCVTVLLVMTGSSHTLNDVL